MLTRVFKSGNSQAVRIPKDFQLNVEEVEIFSRGDELIIKKSKPSLEDAYNILVSMPDDFSVRDIDDDSPQQRDTWE